MGKNEEVKGLTDKGLEKLAKAADNLAWSINHFYINFTPNRETQELVDTLSSSMRQMGSTTIGENEYQISCTGPNPDDPLPVANAIIRSGRCLPKCPRFSSEWEDNKSVGYCYGGKNNKTKIAKCPYL